MYTWLALAVLACSAPDAGDPVAAPPADPLDSCGDGVLAAGETCDDGNALGGDGCLPDCTDEPDPLEIEPNDAPDAANPWAEPVHGGLPDGDVDCFSIEVGDCEALRAELVGDCPTDVVLSLHDPDGIGIATGTVDASGCPVLDPEIAPGARYVSGGTYAVCVTSLTGRVVPAYTLALAVDGDTVFPISDSEDPDADGLPDRCDDDRDGDGVLDDDDNCVDVPNGPDMLPLAPSADGFLRDWLALAPLEGLPNTGECRPSDIELTGGDAALAPHIGDAEASLVWVAMLSDGDRLEFLTDWGWAYPPREVYVHTYVFSATSRDVTLAIGADDGVRAWLEGVQLLDIASCQGTNVDQFLAPTTLLAGWNRLTVKVRDWGGGWGLYARFLDLDGAPVTDLDLSLTPDGPWSDDQGDLDGDGLGDVCDETPAG